jgi:hypothetical protein
LAFDCEDVEPINLIYLGQDTVAALEAVSED